MIIESALPSAYKLLPALLLCSVLSLVGCEAKEPPVASTSKPKPIHRVVETPAAHPPQAEPKTACTLTNDTLAGQPFGSEPTVQELLRTGGKVLSCKPFANLHEAGQMDTILTLQHKGNSFEFYRTPDKDLLRQAVITNFQPSYGQRLRETLNESARQSGGPCGQLRLRDTDRANTVSATFTAGQPSLAHVQPYLD